MTSKRLHYVLAVLLLAAFQAQADTHYVSVSSTNPVPPYTNWATAANVIQDAVDAAVADDTVLVAAGVYDTGGKAIVGTMTNRVAVDESLTLRSVNGPAATIIQGHQVPGTTNGIGAVRCVYLGDHASLIGFTLTGGATLAPSSQTPSPLNTGGGAYCLSGFSVLSNCVVSGNAASGGGGGVNGGTLSHCVISSNSAPFAGGARSAHLANCLVTRNSASLSAGGCMGGRLINSTIAENSAGGSNGGTAQAGVFNSIYYLNSAPSRPQWGGGDFVAYSCTFPEQSAPPPIQWGLPPAPSIASDPLLVDPTAGDYRPQSNSPCINAGSNAYVTTTNDPDGNPRIKGGTVDMGAYEFQDPQSSISYAYLQQYGLPTDGSVDDLDGDGDHATTWEEWKMWTIPTNGLSVLRMLSPDPRTNGTVVSWQSVAGHRYLLEGGTNPTAPFTVIQTDIVGQAGTTRFTDTTATDGEGWFYRVGVPE